MTDWLQPWGSVLLFTVVIVVTCTLTAIGVMLFPAKKEEQAEFEEWTPFFQEVKPAMNKYEWSEEEKQDDANEESDAEAGLFADDNRSYDGEEPEYSR
ncbi:hypothetical protein [Paenibacillus sp. 32O-W]|uniref:hypothetical protein n=1 Tax=Paenibacillus sp. 32O-W TaxID=1695218 RepID=UPI0011A750A0|nr:hypothetical protein [Paenibacillus sp. 32O-W]